eukprot:TRINITY_DN6321_c0_g1_i1.p2 TRINITY_DN6321_c0_g1~~TRINITY_DN6321_c0_g1_i1.p2  ORF type:complete len:248 (+),score=57.03 TRINITY_DN6321_c0_g1_i1:184-927(+)
MYNDDGAALSCQQWEREYFEWLGLPAVGVTAAQLRDPQCGGRMATTGVQVFVMPGGNAYDEQLTAGAAGKNHVLRFIKAGGLYLGTCAGWFYAASGYYWQVGEQGGGKFSWPHTLGLYPEVEGSITTVHDYSDTPPYKLTGLSNGLNAIYWGGPTRGWRSTPKSGSPGRVLATYTAVPGDLMAGVHVKDGSGNRLLFSAHLEAIEGVGIENSGLTKADQLANWQFRAQEIRSAAGLTFAIPSTLNGY